MINRITTTRLYPSGAYECTASVQSSESWPYWHHEVFYRYTKKEAQRKFAANLRVEMKAGRLSWYDR